MTRPYFIAGEEVLLKNSQYPKYNGDYLIYKVLPKNSPHRCRLTGMLIKCEEKHTYLLGFPMKDSDHISGSECLWAESCLRKKPKPSSMSFSEIMAVSKERVS